MSLDVYLFFNGNCREAIDFYADVFQTEIPNVMTFGQAPPDPNHQLPEEAKDLVMHGNLNINGSQILFSDVFPGSPFVEGNNIHLVYMDNDIEKIKHTFDQLKAGGKVTMDLQETFFSKSYGQVTDRFGIHWQISHQS
ncbi:PhnB protein [Seinonella peptonophila]|uniref:PhnB protein n=1 Tax=Seinonella peptonophila TaxID=112248 RepID=A0A1M4X8Y7_9BACL|nr:VOC family protein [Seinonella peptonophila]SHE89954.1 PhnB protein [Seinonella peptonophila]